MLIIETDAAGAIDVEVSMGYVDSVTGVLTVMEQTAVFTVEYGSE